MPRKTPRAAFQGERGAFSEQAARALLGEHVEAVPYQRFEEAFQALASKVVDAAVIPMENTLHGSVHENYDHLLRFGPVITGETNLRIVHNLIAPAGVPFSRVRRVYSHPVALAQCLDFFAKHRHLERVPFYDTAGSVKMIVDEELDDAAAIASSVAAETYGARILKRSIEDDRQNFTRFFLLRRPEDAKDDAKAVKGRDRAPWKTTVVFTTRNAPGSLFRAMSAFALRDISLTKIESRPLRGKPWEYLFYLDFLGRTGERNVENALGHLRELADMMQVLGSYPRG